MSGVALWFSGCYRVQYNEAVVLYESSSKGTQAALHCMGLQDATWPSALLAQPL